MDFTDDISTLGPRGARLWESITEQAPDLPDTMKELALSACRTADRCARLEERCVDTPPTYTNDNGAVITHPVWAEARQQAKELKQLLTALRLPDEKTGKKPQRRGARGAYKPSGGKVSSLERHRQKSS